MSGNGDEGVAGIEFSIGQPTVLGTEENGQGNGAGVLEDLRANLPGRNERPPADPFAGGSTGDPAEALKSFFQRGKNFGLLQNILGRGGHHSGFRGKRVLLGRDQNQPGKAHVFHGPGNRTDIPCILGPDQHDGDVFQKIVCHGNIFKKRRGNS